jgi:hypothetical protein
MYSFIQETIENFNNMTEKEIKEELEKKKNFNNNISYNNTFNYVTTYLKIKETKLNFESLFNPLINFILKHNKKHFKKNNNEYKYFIHVIGGASIKYNVEKYNVKMNNLTYDIDINIVPLENIPNMKIAVINHISQSLKKEFPNFYISIEYLHNAVSILINGIKTFDLMFIDNYNKISSEYAKILINYYRYNNIKNYFDNLIKIYSNNYTLENLEKITFSSLDLELEVMNPLINYFENKIKEKTDIKKINDLKNKINRYNKKLEYIKVAIENRNKIIQNYK